MNFLRAVLILLLIGSSASMVFAEEDFIAPTKISFTVEPGEKFSYDLMYKSGAGGTYDLSTREFHYDAHGEKQMNPGPSPYVKVDQSVYEFKAGEEKKISIQVTIPSGDSGKDVTLGIFLRRRTEDQQTFELGSLVYLRIGQVKDFAGKVSNIKVLSEPSPGTADAKTFRSIAFDVADTSGRYYAVTPVVQFFDQAGVVLQKLENPSSYVFPEFIKSINVFNFSDHDVSFSSPITRATLTVLAENSTVLYEADLPLHEGQVFIAQQRKESPFQGLNIRKGIIYNPAFQFAAIAIGLTFIGISLFMRKS